jgi:hypothetical protein
MTPHHTLSRPPLILIRTIHALSHLAVCIRARLMRGSKRWVVVVRKRLFNHAPTNIFFFPSSPPLIFFFGGTTVCALNCFYLTLPFVSMDVRMLSSPLVHKRAFAISKRLFFQLTLCTTITLDVCALSCRSIYCKKRLLPRIKMPSRQL